MNLTGAAGRNNAIADHLRHGVRAGPDFFRVRIGEWVLVLVFPTRLAGRGVAGSDDVFRVLMSHPQPPLWRSVPARWRTVAHPPPLRHPLFFSPPQTQRPQARKPRSSGPWA